MDLTKTALKVVMFVDVVNYTQMSEKLPLNLFNEMHNKFDQVVHEVIERYDGTIINKIGDAFLCSFKSSFLGVNAGITLQKEFAEYNSTVVPEQHICVRVSLNKGYVLLRDDDIFGTTVNIASRINKYGTVGNVVISEQVYRAVKDDFFETNLLGRKKLKGVEKPVRLYKIKMRSFTKDSLSSNSDQPLVAAVIGVIFFLTIVASFLL